MADVVSSARLTLIRFHKSSMNDQVFDYLKISRFGGFMHHLGLPIPFMMCAP